MFVRRGQFLHQRIGARHRAAQGPANANVFPPGRRLPEHRIERDQLENIDRLETELGRDPVHSFVANESEMLLPEMHQRQRDALRLCSAG